MKKIGINFIENTILFLTEGQRGTETLLDLDLEVIRKYIPEDAKTRSCLVWNFEEGTCTVCEDYMLSKADKERGCLIVEECFVERPDLSYPCQVDFKEFTKALGYEEVDLKDDLKALLSDFGVTI